MTGGMEYLEEIIGQIEEHFSNNEYVQPYSFSHDGNGSDENRNHVENVPLGEYYNNDEGHTYHWTSDGSNTDEAGNVIYHS